MFWSFILIAAICECGERVTEQFNEFNDRANQCKWYDFPLDLQRMLLTFICDVQQPVQQRGFGSIVCSRDALKAVSDSDHTYELSPNE